MDTAPNTKLAENSEATVSYTHLSLPALLNLSIWLGDINVEEYLRIARIIFPPPASQLAS